MNKQQIAERRRQRAESIWRERFDEFDLSERFEFICRDWRSDKGRKAMIKCRTCGAEFSTWGLYEVFKGNQTHLLCPVCGAASDGAGVWERSPRCDEAMAYYVQGHTVLETAKKFGVSKYQINNSVKNRRLTNGRNWRETRNEAGERLRREAEQRLAERLDALGFDYIGGYAGRDGTATIKCRACGDVFERTADFIKTGNLICRKCEHEKALARQAERRMIRKVEAERKRTERETERLLRPPKNYYEKTRNEFLDRVGTCKVCGKSYRVRDYVESCGLKYARDGGYCSAECRDVRAKEIVRISHKGRQDSHRSRARRFGCKHDSSITLKKLVERDGLRCAICGEMCNWNDHSWSRYSGPTYPSIDHIVPMSKGGGHTWDNVQVTHIICNSLKGDKLEEDKSHEANSRGTVQGNTYAS